MQSDYRVSVFPPRVAAPGRPAGLAGEAVDLGLGGRVLHVHLHVVEEALPARPAVRVVENHLVCKSYHRDEQTTSTGRNGNGDQHDTSPKMRIYILVWHEVSNFQKKKTERVHSGQCTTGACEGACEYPRGRLLTDSGLVGHDAALLHLQVRLVAARRHDVLDVVRVLGRTVLHPEPDVVVLRLKLPAASAIPNCCTRS